MSKTKIIKGTLPIIGTLPIFMILHSKALHTIRCMVFHFRFNFLFNYPTATINNFFLFLGIL